MPFCDIPRCPDIIETPCLRTSPISRGDVAVAYASSSHPLAVFCSQYLKDSQKSAEARALDNTLRAQSIKTQHSSTGKGGIGKHAVIVTSATIAPMHHLIYIITTVGGSDPSTFPKFLTRFLLPISTTQRAESHIRHLHLIPSWGDVGKPVWLIAFPYPVGNINLEHRWEDGEWGKRTNYSLDTDSLGMLELITREIVANFEREELPAQNKEVEEYMVSFNFLVDTN